MTRMTKILPIILWIAVVSCERKEAILEIQQPGTEVFWLKCPLGQRWSGKGCTGEAVEEDWNRANVACPEGYRLPRLSEMQEILGGCEEKVIVGRGGRCSKCNESDVCKKMFGEREMSYWSGDANMEYGGKGAWYASFYWGLITDDLRTNKRRIRCVRNGLRP